jgi:hypothetical protein
MTRDEYIDMYFTAKQNAQFESAFRELDPNPILWNMQKKEDSNSRLWDGQNKEEKVVHSFNDLAAK